MVPYFSHCSRVFSNPEIPLTPLNKGGTRAVKVPLNKEGTRAVKVPLNKGGTRVFKVPLIKGDLGGARLDYKRDLLWV